jgi:hypothetical protein
MQLHYLNVDAVGHQTVEDRLRQQRVQRLSKPPAERLRALAFLCRAGHRRLGAPQGHNGVKQAGAGLPGCPVVFRRHPDGPPPRVGRPHPLPGQTQQCGCGVSCGGGLSGGTVGGGRHRWGI